MRVFHWPGGGFSDSSWRKMSWVDSPKVTCYLIYHSVKPPCTSNIYLNIFPNFQKSIHLSQKVLIPHLTYKNFYTRFSLDTRHSAWLLVFIPEFNLLVKLCSTFISTVLINYLLNTFTVPTKNWRNVNHGQSISFQTLAFVSERAFCTACRIWACTSLPAAITPKLSPSVRPSPKSKASPRESVTIPPASSTRIWPGAWSFK